MNGTSKPRPLKVTMESNFFAASQNCVRSSASSAQGMNFTGASASSTSSKSSATKSDCPRKVSGLSMAMQTTCDVNGHNDMKRVISSRLAFLEISSPSFSVSRKRYSCCASSKFSSGSAVVSMSKTSVAIMFMAAKSAGSLSAKFPKPVENPLRSEVQVVSERVSFPASPVCAGGQMKAFSTRL